MTKRKKSWMRMKRTTMRERTTMKRGKKRTMRQQTSCDPLLLLLLLSLSYWS
jgi:hypothetical protein